MNIEISSTTNPRHVDDPALGLIADGTGKTRKYRSNPADL
jgi:hypothetical protein